MNCRINAAFLIKADLIIAVHKKTYGKSISIIICVRKRKNKRRKVEKERKNELLESI
jgi:hypothetical protein